ncbi:MAG: hypothetical protein IKB71_10540, partial [Lentisphaeria bacterium]|nr:hypothetical protein [Lentisphaeria bacterium]
LRVVPGAGCRGGVSPCKKAQNKLSPHIGNIALQKDTFLYLIQALSNTAELFLLLHSVSAVKNQSIFSTKLKNLRTGKLQQKKSDYKTEQFFFAEFAFAEN